MKVELTKELSVKFESCSKFIEEMNVVAFGKTGEFVEKWFSKGKPIGISGRLQSGKYVNKDGVTVYTLDVIAEEVEFVGSKSDSGNTESAPATSKPSEEFMQVDEELEAELPFN